jgi:hypothetical protein
MRITNMRINSFYPHPDKECKNVLRSIKKPVWQTQHHVYPRFFVSCYRPQQLMYLS